MGGKFCLPSGLVRPVLIFSHVLLACLVMAVSQQDRMWNWRVKGLVPFPSLAEEFECNDTDNSSDLSCCCGSDILKGVQPLYEQQQKIERSLIYYDFAWYLGVASSIVTVGASLIELIVIGGIDSKGLLHKSVNQVCSITYIVSIALLSTGLVDMTPKSLQEGDYCGSTDVAISEKLEQIIDCYAATGACRDQESLLLVLIFSISYPILCFLCYLLIGCLTGSCESSNNNDSCGSSSSSSKGTPMTPDMLNARANLHRILSLLQTDPSCKKNEHYLDIVANSFKEYIRTGFVPRVNLGPKSLPSLNVNVAATHVKSPAYRAIDIEKQVQDAVKPTPS